MTAVLPGRAPTTDAAWARSVEDRLRGLQNPRTLRVGPWVLSTEAETGNLIATRPGQTVVIDGEGATETAPAKVSLAGLVTDDQLALALDGLPDSGGGIESLFADLYEMLTGTGIDPLGALSKLAEFFKMELGGPIDLLRLPLLPLAHIRNIVTELLSDSFFDNPLTLANVADWDWFDGDTAGTKPGVAQTTADGLTHTIYSDPIPVALGDSLNVLSKVKWLGLATSGANPIRMFVSFYDEANAMIGAPLQVGQTGAAGSSVGFVTMRATEVAVPAEAAYAIQELTVTPAATAGTVRFGQGSVTKAGLLPQGYVSGLQQAITSLWSGITARIQEWADLLDVFGGFAVGSGQGQLTDVFNRIKNLNPLNGLFDASKLGNMAGLPNIPDGLTKVGDLGALVDMATGALSGAFSAGETIVGAGLTAVEHTMANLFEMITATTRKVQALETAATANSVGGRQFNINFSNYPDGPFPAGLFNVTYSGPGTSVLVIKGGNAVWQMVNNGYRRATLRYPTPTLTSFQVVRGTTATPPNRGTNVRIWSVGRANSAMTDYVFARGYCTGFLSYKGDIGIVRNGVEYIWASGISLTWSLDLRVIMGVGNNPRRHMVLSGDTVVWDGIEPVDKQSYLDADHMYWGSVSETSGAQHPGEIAGASTVDNAPPAVVGTTFRASKRTGGDMTLASGNNQVPNNFYETVDYISPDLIYRPADRCSLEVSKQGTYVVSWRAYHGIYATNTGGHGVLFKNGVPFAKWTWGDTPFVVGFAVMTSNTNATTGSALVPMDPGDKLSVGFYFTANMANTGDNVLLADGSETWFAAARLGI